MKHVFLFSVLFASLFLLGCVQQGGERAATVPSKATGTPTLSWAPATESAGTPAPITPPATPTVDAAGEIQTAEGEESADAAIAETEALDAAGNASDGEDIDASDLDRLE